MFIPAEKSAELLEEFSRHPYGPHSPALQALLTWLRTRPRARKLILYREPSGTGLRLCELDGNHSRLHTLVEQPFAKLEDAERAALVIRWRENFGQEARPTTGAE